MVRGLKYKQGQLSISKSFLRFVVIAMMLSGAIAWAVAAIPEGAIVAIGRAETRGTQVPQNATAEGGNVTEVNITSNSQTAVWQGFFGNVNGSLVLEDASGDTFYSWNLSNTSGEVYASRNNTIDFSAVAPVGNCSLDNDVTGFDFSDSVNNTYLANNSQSFAVGNIQFNVSQTCGTNPYVTGSPQSVDFFNAILVEDVTTNDSTIYVALIEPAGTAGYDGASYRYQLLVPVNRSTGFTIYSFYAELN